MLKGLPDFIDAELLWVLAAMGHGDELAVVDRNFPAHSLARGTRSGKLVTLGGMNVADTIAGIVSRCCRWTTSSTPRCGTWTRWTSPAWRCPCTAK